MNNKSKTGAGGIGVSGLLQVAFIVLKLCGVINWSWWWVLAPCWITVGFLVLGLVAAVIIALADK